MTALAQAARAALRNVAFHEGQHRNWRTAALGLLATNLALALALAGFVMLHSTAYITVASTPDGRLIPLTPLEEPIMSDAALRSWATRAITESFTLGHHDWQMRLAGIRDYFTDRGYESFVGSLESSLFLTRLRENRQVASAVARGAAVVTQTRILDGRATWTLELPFLVTFTAGTRSVTQDLVARVLVQRVPLSDRPAGIGIVQLVAERRGREVAP